MVHLDDLDVPVGAEPRGDLALLRDQSTHNGRVRRLRAFETPTEKSKRKAKLNAKRAKAKKNRFNMS